MSIAKPAFYFGAGNVANGGPAGPSLRRESRIRKGWTVFDVWQDRVDRVNVHCGRSAGAGGLMGCAKGG